ncbi:MAG: V-type ATP synthase subunit E family protein [Candidatus Krumholzibacteriales bacterium]
MANEESVEKICRRIREDGEKEAESILDKAERTASGIIDRAGKKKDRIAEEILKEAEENGENEYRRLLSSIKIELKRERLRVREEVIEHIMENVREALKSIREGDRYADILQGMIMTGISALGGSSFIVSVDSRDLKLTRDRVIPAVEEKVKQETGIDCRLEVEQLSRHTLGGARIQAAEGKVAYDNTFEARMHRLNDEIRNVIFEEVFQPSGSEGSGSA